MIKHAIWIGLAVSLVAARPAAPAQADDWHLKTVITFGQPVEIPGQVLAAGTYTFRLADSTGDRHIVQILNADGSRILATVMTMPDFRLKTTKKTVIKFGEGPAGSPGAFRAWF